MGMASMVTNVHKLNKFYQKLIKKEKISHGKALAIYEALHREAVCLGVINHENILDGLEVDLKIAKVLNQLV